MRSIKGQMQISRHPKSYTECMGNTRHMVWFSADGVATRSRLATCPILTQLRSREIINFKVTLSDALLSPNPTPASMFSNFVS
jgi:hypothetical protein